uniref:Uncharacterized protein n=1 Tax=Globisporangium ultimum (strain ATCC 200006 / CBS 805.95 / DAOM BR144) TaxID=431595 RepID=K3X7W5_GLOUD
MVESFVLEWRENSEHSLELIRRVMYSDVISAIALSACSSWLFTGHRSGALKVWNVATGGLQSRVLSYQLESSPLEPELSTQHRDPVDIVRLSATTPSASSELENQTQLVPTEIMVITATRDSGLVKHWRFQVTYQSMMSDRRHSFEAAKVLSLAPKRELSPKIELVGAYNTESSLINEQATPMLKKSHPKKLVENIIATVPIWVTIDMSGFTESLLLVLRDDVIHVLKVQSVMRVVQELPAFEDIASIRIVEHQAIPTLVSLSGSHASSVRVSPLDSSASAVMQNASYRHQIVLPPSQHSSSFVSAMECFQLDQQRSFVVYGWSTGGLEIHSLYPSKRVRLLQDPHLNAHVTAICVIPDNRREIARVQFSAPLQSPNTGSKAMSTRSWGGMLKLRDSRPQYNALVGSASHGDANAAQDQVQSSEVYVFAGTASGQIFGWKVPFPQDPNEACRFLLESKVSVNSAHSAHVVQLVALQQDNEGAQRLVSLGADGMVKVWDIATMSIIGYVNAATGSHLSIASCVEIVTGGRDDEKHYLAVGFEDGMLAVWSLDYRRLSFLEVQVASHHERRVTSICSGSNSSEASGALEFLTCSLDMTTIVWVIHEDKVVEKRYFDVGAPIIDFCVAENQAIFNCQ